jgi:uncharacterized protein (TIGR02246 family)
MQKLGFSITVLAAAIILSATLSPVQGKKDDSAEIKALEERLGKAVAAKNVDAIMENYVSDESLFVFDVIPPRQYVGAKAYRKDWTDFLGTFDGPVAFELSDLAVTTAGDLAYSHSAQRMSGTDKKGKKLDFTVRVTDVYRKAHGKWLITHEHASVPVDFDTGKPDLSSKL